MTPLNDVTKNISESVIKLVGLIGEEWLSLYELLDITSYKSRPTFTKTHLRPAIEAGLIALKIPDKPQAPNQKYGLTLKGKALHYAQRNSVNDLQSDPQNELEGQESLKDANYDPQKETIFAAIKSNPSISRTKLAIVVGCSESTIKRRLKEWNIAWLGYPKTGHWVIIRDI